MEQRQAVCRQARARDAAPGAGQQRRRVSGGGSGTQQRNSAAWQPRRMPSKPPPTQCLQTKPSQPPQAAAGPSPVRVQPFFHAGARGGEDATLLCNRRGSANVVACGRWVGGGERQQQAGSASRRRWETPWSGPAALVVETATRCTGLQAWVCPTAWSRGERSRRLPRSCRAALQRCMMEGAEGSQPHSEKLARLSAS